MFKEYNMETRDESAGGSSSDPTSYPSDKGNPRAGRAWRPKEYRRRSIVKTISWRTIGSLDTMLIAFVVFWITGPDSPGAVARSATLVGLFEVPNKLLLYYFHERVWSRIKWGQAPLPPEYEI